MSYQDEHMEWFVKNGSDIVGPLDWWDLEVGVRSGEISDIGYLKNNKDNEWISIKDYFSKLDGKEDDAIGGLMPNGTDAIFLLGLFIFFIGVGTLFLNNFLGYGVLLISLMFEFGSIYYSHRNTPKSITKNVGNILALLWAGFQTLITIGIIFFTIL